MKKIMIAIIVIACFLAFMPSNRALADDRSMELVVDVVALPFKALFELGKIIKGANTDSDLVLGKELEAYKINSKYKVLVSDGSYKKIPSIIFYAYNDKAEYFYHIGFEKNNAEDMLEIKDFNKINIMERKIFIKKIFLKYHKLDLGEIDTTSIPAPAVPPASASTAEPKKDNQ